MDYPKLGVPIFWGLVSIFCLVLSWKQENWPEWVRLLFGLVGLFLLVVTLLTGLDTLSFETNERLMEYQRAMAVTERVALVEKIQKLRPDQIAVLDRYVPTIELISGDAGPIYMLRLPTMTVPMNFIREFIGKGDAADLCTIRTYAEGSRERDWAQRFTEWAVFNGWAAPAAGNRPAGWVDRQRCLRALGI